MTCTENVLPIITNVFSLAGEKQYTDFCDKPQIPKLQPIAELQTPLCRILPKSNNQPRNLSNKLRFTAAKGYSSFQNTSGVKVNDPFKGIPEEFINDLAYSIGNDPKSNEWKVSCGTINKVHPVNINAHLDIDNLSSLKSLLIPTTKSMLPQVMISNSNSIILQKPVLMAKGDTLFQPRPAQQIINPVSPSQSTFIHQTVNPVSLLQSTQAPRMVTSLSLLEKGDTDTSKVLSTFSAKPANILVDGISNTLSSNNPMPVFNITPYPQPPNKGLVRILPKTLLSNYIKHLPIGNNLLSASANPLTRGNHASANPLSCGNHQSLTIGNNSLPTEKNSLSALHRTVGSIRDISCKEPSINIKNNPTDKTLSCDFDRLTNLEISTSYGNPQNLICIDSVDEAKNVISIDSVEEEAKNVISKDSIEEEEAKAIAASLFIDPLNISNEANELNTLLSNSDQVMDSIDIGDGYQCDIDDSLPVIVSDIKIKSNENSKDGNEGELCSEVNNIKAIKKEEGKNAKKEDSDIETSDDDDGAYEASDDSEYRPDEGTSSSDSNGSDSDDNHHVPSKKIRISCKKNQVDINHKIKAIQSKNIPILPAPMNKLTVEINIPVSDTIKKQEPVSLTSLLNSQKSIVFEKIDKMPDICQTSLMSTPTVSPLNTKAARNKPPICLNQVLDIINMKRKNKGLPIATSSILVQCPTSISTLECTTSIPTLQCTTGIPAPQCTTSVPTLQSTARKRAPYWNSSMGKLHCRSTSIAMLQCNTSIPTLQYTTSITPPQCTTSISTLQCTASIPASQCTTSTPMLQYTTSTPTLLCTTSTPTLLCTTSTPALLCTASTPTLLCTTSTPTLLCTTSTPTLLCTTSTPTLLCTTSTPTLLCTTSTPTLLCTTSIPTPLCTTSIPTSLCTTSIPTSLCTTSIPTLHCTTSKPTLQYTISIPTFQYTTNIPTPQSNTSISTPQCNTIIPMPQCTTSIPLRQCTTSIPMSQCTTSVSMLQCTVRKRAPHWNSNIAMLQSDNSVPILQCDNSVPMLQYTPVNHSKPMLQSTTTDTPTQCTTNLPTLQYTSMSMPQYSSIPTQNTQLINSNLSKTQNNIKEQQINNINQVYIKIEDDEENITKPNKLSSDGSVATDIKCDKCKKDMFSLVELVSHLCVPENEIKKAIQRSVTLHNVAEAVLKQEKVSVMKVVHQNITTNQSPTINQTPATTKNPITVSTKPVLRQSSRLASKLAIATPCTCMSTHKITLTSTTFALQRTKTSEVVTSQMVKPVSLFQPRPAQHIINPVSSSQSTFIRRTVNPVSLLQSTQAPRMVTGSEAVVPPNLPIPSTHTIPMYLVAQPNASGKPGQMLLVSANTGKSSAVPLKLIQLPNGGVQLVAQSNPALPVFIKPNAQKTHSILPQIRPLPRPVATSIRPLAPASSYTLRNPYGLTSISPNTYIPQPIHLNLMAGYAGNASTSSTVQLLRRAQNAPIPITCITTTCSMSSPVPITCITTTCSMSSPVPITCVKTTICSTSSTCTNTKSEVVSLTMPQLATINSPTDLSPSNLLCSITRGEHINSSKGSKTSAERNVSNDGMGDQVESVSSKSPFFVPLTISTRDGKSDMKAKLPELAPISCIATTVATEKSSNTIFLPNISKSPNVSSPLLSLLSPSSNVVYIGGKPVSIPAPSTNIVYVAGKPVRVTSAVPTPSNKTQPTSSAPIQNTGSIHNSGHTLQAKIPQSGSTLRIFNFNCSTSTATNTSLSVVNVLNSLTESKVNVNQAIPIQITNNIDDKTIALNKIASPSYRTFTSKDHPCFNLNDKPLATRSGDVRINLIGRSSLAGSNTPIVTVPASALTVNLPTKSSYVSVNGNIGKIGTSSNNITQNNFIVNNKLTTAMNPSTRFPILRNKLMNQSRPIVQTKLNNQGKPTVETILNNYQSRPIVQAKFNNQGKPAVPTNLNSQLRSIIRANMTNQVKPHSIQFLNIPRPMTLLSNKGSHVVLLSPNSTSAPLNILTAPKTTGVARPRLTDLNTSNVPVTGLSGTVNSNESIPVLPSSSSHSLPAIDLSKGFPISMITNSRGITVNGSETSLSNIKTDLIKSKTAVDAGDSSEQNNPGSNVPAENAGSNSEQNKPDIENKIPSGHIPIQLGLTEKLFIMSGKKRLKHQFMANRYETKFTSAIGFEMCLQELEGDYFNIRKGALNVNINMNDYIGSLWNKRKRSKVSRLCKIRNIIEVLLSDEEDSDELGNTNVEVQPENTNLYSESGTRTNGLSSNEHVSMATESVSSSKNVTMDTSGTSPHENAHSEQRASPNSTTDDNVYGSHGTKSEDMLIRKRKSETPQHTHETKKHKNNSDDLLGEDEDIITENIITENMIDKLDTTEIKYTETDTIKSHNPLCGSESILDTTEIKYTETDTIKSHNPLCESELILDTTEIKYTKTDVSRGQILLDRPKSLDDTEELKSDLSKYVLDVILDKAESIMENVADKLEQIKFTKPILYKDIEVDNEDLTSHDHENKTDLPDRTSKLPIDDELSDNKSEECNSRREMENNEQIGGGSSSVNKNISEDKYMEIEPGDCKEKRSEDNYILEMDTLSPSKLNPRVLVENMIQE